LTAFPEVSAEDLLFEDRTLSVSAAKLPTTPSSQEILPLTNLFDAPNDTASESIKNNLPESTIVRSNLRRSSKEVNLASLPTGHDSVSENAPSSTRSLHKKIERVIIFYTDGTFIESKPSD
jgi:hypothetical protein